MSTKMEYTGKDVSEAIKNACSQLNVPQDQLNIEIASTGSAGIFGLCRRKAKILVSLKGEAREEISPAPRPGRKSKAAPPEPAPARPTPVPKEPVPPREEHPPQDVTAIMADVEGDLSRLVALMGLPARVEMSQDGNKILAQITGENVEAIIGPDGQTLDNIQYLLRKMITKKHPEKVSLSINAGNYREDRTQELEEMARRLAAEVKESGRTRSIPALNPAERRIVHMVLQEDTAIRSRSVGDGLFKKILIYLPGKGKKRPPRGGRNSKPAAEE
ncbi:MAG: Jag N-terminal domain-containing protein [Desulfobacteraceae bacterium]|nr:Jag N-terminal domain-containing protein [Desulfobacteraceae bacterium]